MNNDKMRAEFEVWAVNMGLTLRGSTGNYLKEIQCAWMAWQASRAALVVDLEHAHRTLEATPFGGTMYSGEVIKAIQSAGVSVK